jgi:cytochrome c oxidase subunit 2
MSPLPTWPVSASPYAHKVDVLFWTLTGITGTVALAIFAVIIVFAIRYRRAAVLARGAAREPVATGKRWVEITWIVVPLLIFLAVYVWAANLYLDYATPPGQTLEIYVLAKQWMWKVEHANGRREINELHIPRGQPVKLVMTSQDVIHSFYVPAFRVKHDVLPGRYTVLWFEPTQVGVYHLFCAEYCGTDHSRMGGGVVVMEPEDFDRWLSSGSPTPTLAAAGEAKFRAFGCGGCHGANATIRAPPLEGLFGHDVPLADGRFALADERYVRDSILLPSQDVAAGYSNVMPSFAGRVSEEDILELIAYVKSLADGSAGRGDPR